jgi:stress response protein YsnF
MPEVIVAVFKTAVDADEAVRALEANNLPSSAIRRYRRDDPSIPGRPESTQEQGVHYQSQAAPADTRASGGFWSWLTGEDRGDWRDPNYADTDDQYYSRSVEAGNTVVAVHVDQVDSERVMRLLADQNPIGLEDTGAEATTSTTSGNELRMGTTAEQRSASGEQRMGVTHGQHDETIPLAEEQVQVGKERVERPVRVRRFVVERPVEQQVNLRNERVEIERRPAQGTAVGPWVRGAHDRSP